MTKVRGVLSLVLAGLVTGGVSVAVSGQSRSGAPPAGDELLAEIRGLRADLAQAMSANIRAQLLVGRLQLQEQRMNALTAQIAQVRRSIGDLDSERDDKSAQIARLQEALDGGQLPAQQQKEVRSMIALLKQELSRPDGQQEQLRGQESLLSGQLVAEEGRWIYFNDSLDAIERSLPEVSPGVPQR
jgi:chromosome segregation ATPase